MKLKNEYDLEEIDQLNSVYVSKNKESPQKFIIEYDLHGFRKKEIASIEKFSSIGIVIRTKNDLKVIPYSNVIEIADIEKSIEDKIDNK